MGRIVYIKGDLFSSNADYLVNAVNTVGVMGKGIAKSFKEKYPATNDTYVSVCRNHNFDIDGTIGESVETHFDRRHGLIGLDWRCIS